MFVGGSVSNFFAMSRTKRKTGKEARDGGKERGKEGMREYEGKREERKAGRGSRAVRREACGGSESPV